MKLFFFYTIMWKCHKCGKPVYFAERKQSLGYDWHPECLRCEECGKRLNPGQHAEHKGVPYCHVPCYGALFGPQLFGHGTRVESHTSFGKVENRIGGPNMPRSLLETKLKAFNQYYDGKSGEIRSREVNGRLVLEGALRIHWGVLNMIHLKEDDDQRTVVTIRKRNSYRNAIFNGMDDDDDDDEFDSVDYVERDQVIADTDELAVAETEENRENQEVPKCHTLPVKLDKKRMEWDEIDELLQVERQVEEGEKIYRTMPVVGLPTISSQSSVEEIVECGEHCTANCMKEVDENVNRDAAAHLPPHPPPKTGSTAIRRRPGRIRSRTKLKRRCSINGHFYNRETSFFTPPYGSQMSVWVTSLVSTNEVINLMLEKYKVDSKPYNFALFVVRDNGEQRRLRDDEYPLLVRVMLGPHEDVAKLFLMDRQGTEEISSEVAQFLNLSLAECRAILERYHQEEEREAKRTRSKYRELKRRIKQRMEELKVRL
ncbi:hypothetical protein J437_LFUL000359 [Ladona fulva]|uniref:Ras association domain-containing protein 2 n=1 Tax=Ladona fulva TaxID=123851 RepID=A0A8K0JVI8_LADFU|nr:hypothetical protein J437_LFUL000359 [Ladona fulva]